MRNRGHYKRNLLSAAVLTLLLAGHAMGANFTTTLTGDVEKDKDYADVYMNFAKAYIFDGDDTIKVSGASAIKASKDLNIDSPGNLTLITDTAYTYGIDQGTANNVNISLNKKTLTIQSKAEGRTEGIHMDKTSGKRQTMNIKGNVDITSVNTTGGYALGVFANGLADLHVTGNFKAHVDGQNADAGGGPLSASAVYASGLMNGKEGAAKVVIDGDLDLSGNANGLTANIGGASIEANGGRIEMNQDNTLGFAALRASNGMISLNTKTSDGEVVSAGKKVEIRGNVVASTFAVNAADTHGTSTSIRLGLDTEDSSLEGGIYVEGKPADKIDFNSAITGGEDKDWKANGIQKEDGKYVMDKDITITMDGKAGIEAEKDFAINAKDHTLTITNQTKAGNMQYGVHIGTDGDYTIEAEKLAISVDTTGGSAYSAIGIGLGDMGGSSKARLTINSDVDIRSNGKNMSFGVYALGEQHLTINGNVSMTGSADDWGINNPESYPGALGHYHTNGLYAGFGTGTIDVNGEVNLTVKGTGIQANGGAAITVSGGGRIQIAEDKVADQYALAAEAGTVSFHWKDPVVRSADRSSVRMTGNVGVLNKDSGISPNSKDMPATVQFTLDTKDSLWKGVAFNQYKEQGLDSGTIRMGLMNGATWINSAYGMVRDGFTGSKISDFHGGSDAAHAGNIFQKDANSLTIDNYSGCTNIYYAHEGNGEAVEIYKAGDIIIKKAADGSQISLITDNTNVAMDNEHSVAKVLNALAGKLTYSPYAKGKKNLTGYVKIADGLTASSKVLRTGKIDFSDTDGKGSLAEGTVVTPGVTPAPNPQPGTGTESPKIEDRRR